MIMTSTLITMYVGYAAGIVSLAAYAFYASSILRGKTRPSRATWIIWSVVTVLIAASYWGTGATNTIWAAVGEAVGTLIICGLSIKYGLGGWEKTDKWAFVGAGIGLLLWFIFGNPFIALIAFLMIDFSAALPTAVKLYKKPWEEEWFPWAVTVSANALNIFALNILHPGLWELDVAFYPFYMVIINGVILFFILRPMLGLYRK